LQGNKRSSISSRKSAGSENELLELRKEIQEVTESILDLVRARQILSVKIARIKKSKNLPVEDLYAERSLLANIQNFANTIELDAKLTETLARLLIDESKKVQRREIFLKSVKSFLAKSGVHTVSIVGAGRMGSWFAEYFRPLASEIKIFDTNQRLARQMARKLQCHSCRNIIEAADSDLVFVSVPISSTINVINSLTRGFSRTSRKSQWILEISSVKGPLFNSTGFSSDLESKDKKIRIVSLHPLFGASADYYGSNSMIRVLPAIGGGKNESFVQNLFPYFRMITLDFKSHDKLMALILTVPHLLLLGFASIVVNNQKIMRWKIHSPTFDGMMNLSQKMLLENPQVYYEIQSLNKYSRAEINAAVKSMMRLGKFLRKAKKFERYFANARHYFSKLDRRN